METKETLKSILPQVGLRGKNQIEFLESGINDANYCRVNVGGQFFMFIEKGDAVECRNDFIKLIKKYIR